MFVFTFDFLQVYQGHELNILLTTTYYDKPVSQLTSLS